MPISNKLSEVFRKKVIDDEFEVILKDCQTTGHKSFNCPEDYLQMGKISNNGQLFLGKLFQHIKPNSSMQDAQRNL